MSENILPSVFNRLIDDEPENSTEPVQNRYMSIRQVKNFVLKDVENLLNTRRYIYDIPPELKALNNSLINYGIKDFISQNPKNPAVKKMLKQDMEKTIARFEPRLKNVNVSFEQEQKENAVRFRINALLVLDEESEPVSFDTVLDVNRGEYVVKE